MFPFTLNQLRILKSVAIEQSFTKAAAKLYLSQSSLSKRVMLLEKNLGIKIIKRQGTQIFLTKRGNIFLKYSERILALCEESCRVMTKIEKNEKLKLKIGVSQAFGANLLPRLLFACIPKDTKFNLKLTFDSAENLAKQLLSQNLDLVLTSTEIYNFLSNDVKIKINFCMQHSIYLILSPFHSFIKRESINKKELYTLNYITLESNRISYINSLLQLNQIDINHFKTILYLDSIESIKTAVKLGLGASFISSLDIEKEIKLEMLKTIKIQQIKIDQPLFLLNTKNCSYSRTYTVFYTKLLKLRKITLTDEGLLKKS